MAALSPTRLSSGLIGSRAPVGGAVKWRTARAATTARIISNGQAERLVSQQGRCGERWDLKRSKKQIGGESESESESE
eukprot:scaffold48688_cov36-Tisochrysis_lutea.AAC.1